MSRVVGQNRYEVSGRLMVVWAWFDQITASGELSGVSFADIDEIAGSQGFAAAMHQAGWLAGEDGKLQVPNWERHNGNSAKARALEAEAKRLRRLSDNVSDNCPTFLASNVRPEASRGEETRREKKRTLVDQVDQIDRREKSQAANAVDSNSNPSTSSTASSRSTRKILKGEAETAPPFDLSHVDWGQVLQMAESVQKHVPPKTKEDRRAWFKYAVMAYCSFSEGWLIDAAVAASQANDVKKSRQALFVRALQIGAQEKHDIDKENFDGMFSRIQIPTNIWKSDVLKLKGVTI